jgi:hypothetical protein
MSLELSKFENMLLTRLSEKYPMIKTHLPHIRVKDREVTGVGMYVNFEYAPSEGLDLEDLDGRYLSTEEVINFKGLENGIGYVLCITDGRINFFEFFTYGESWDGNVPDDFVLTPRQE